MKKTCLATLPPLIGLTQNAGAAFGQVKSKAVHGSIILSPTAGRAAHLGADTLTD